MSRYLPITFLLLGSFVGPTWAQTVGTCQPSLGEAFLDVGNVKARILNNGNLFWRGSSHVYEVPKGGGVNAMFSSSIWIGGLVDGKLHFAGSLYGPYEFWAGPLPDDGGAPENCEQFDRLWSVSRDEIEAYDRFGSLTPDLADWPTGLGAPTVDARGVPIDVSALPLLDRLDRKIRLDAGERPDITGDQMVWWVMNDLGGAHLRSRAEPLGVEIHGSAFAFKSSGALGNTTFYRLKVRKPSGDALESAFVSVYQDTYLGNFDDDYIGSDSTLGLGYVYNADNFDEAPSDEVAGYGMAPPAVGLDFFQGARVESDGMDNDADGSVDEPGERVPMTAFVYFQGAGGVGGTPFNGAEMYTYMRGRWTDGRRVTEGGNGQDFSSIPTNFMFSGNPPAFWSELDADGIGHAFHPGDRRFIASSGPFSLGPDEPQEIVFGIVTSFGADNLDSVRQLKEDDAFIQDLVDEGLFDSRAVTLPDPVPEHFELAASFYPLPASDLLTVRYSLPQQMAVSIKVYDLLGKLQTTVVDGVLQPGDYSEEIDVSPWPPGAYVARIRMDHRLASRRIVVVP